MERPVEKLLAPESMHEYLDLVRQYGFTGRRNITGFNLEGFYREWDRRYAAAVQHCAVAADGLIRVYANTDAVYSFVETFAPVLSQASYGAAAFAEYYPGWYDFMGDVFTVPKPGMRGFKKNEINKFLAVLDREYDLFRYFERMEQPLDIMILDDYDRYGRSGTIVLKNDRHDGLHCGITLTCEDAAKIEKPDTYESGFFQELCHVLLCIHTGSESADTFLPDNLDSFVTGNFRGRYHSAEDKRWFGIKVLTEGMLAGTDLEKYFCPNKITDGFQDAAKDLFLEVIDQPRAKKLKLNGSAAAGWDFGIRA